MIKLTQAHIIGAFISYLLGVFIVPFVIDWSQKGGLVDLPNERKISVKNLKTNESSIKESILNAYIDGKYYNFCGDVNVEFNKKTISSRIEQEIQKKGDELISEYKGKYKDPYITDGSNEIALGASNGRMVKFNENDVRIMGRTASGVKGIELDNSSCIGAEIASEDDVVIIVTKKGYGKQTTVRDYRETKRGSKGVKALSITDKNGDIASFKIARPDTDIVIITDAGMVMRMPLDQISVLGRVTQGVRLINLKDNQKVTTVALVEKEIESEETEEENFDVIKVDAEITVDDKLETVVEE